MRFHHALILFVFTGVISWASGRLIETYRSEGTESALADTVHDNRTRIAVLEQEMRDCRK